MRFICIRHSSNKKNTGFHKKTTKLSMPETRLFFREKFFFNIFRLTMSFFFRNFAKRFLEGSQSFKHSGGSGFWSECQCFFLSDHLKKQVFGARVRFPEKRKKHVI